ncbi:MAG: Peptidylprolyl isomerase [Acidimicrobiia bacterium]|jgi:cyclophilin family peptidyl-prolyl cis-trans isomerase|nr:Peptidylprolyl isomerase [Acidimicrobiia bacterium]
MTDRRRRQKEQRAAKLEAEKKQEARKELGRRLGTALVFGVVVVGIVVAGAYFGSDEGELPQGYADFREQPTACGAEQPEPEPVLSFGAPEPQTDVTAESTVIVTLETSCGDIVIELDPAGYPVTTNSFVFLVREGFFDGQVFHRIVQDFRVFSGDPEANGSGGPGYRIADEFPADDFALAPGMVMMDNVGRGTTGSQFFVLTGEAASALNPQFNLLGEVVSGEVTLEAIAGVETAVRPGSTEQSLPLETVYIERATVDVTDS